MSCRLSILLILFANALTAAVYADPVCLQNYESQSARVVLGHISDGQIETQELDPEGIKKEINAQLMYAMGQINAINGTVDLTSFKVDLSEVTPNNASGLRTISYTADFRLSLPTEVEFKSYIELTLPKRGNNEWLSLFFDRFALDALSSCREYSIGYHGQHLFFYYFRPNNFNCRLSSANFRDDKFILRTKVNLVSLPKVPQKTMPDHDAVWSDGKLKVLVLATSISDAGFMGQIKDSGDESSEKFLETIKNRFGNHKNFQISNRPLSFYRKLTTISFSLGDSNKLVEINIMKINDIYELEWSEYNSSNELAEQLRSQSIDADLIIYSGHSGYGKNISSFGKRLSLGPDRYRIVYLDACNTFAYIDDVWPKSTAKRHLDLITTGVPVSGVDRVVVNRMALIDGLIGATKTYSQILGNMSFEDRLIVRGVCDN